MRNRLTTSIILSLLGTPVLLVLSPAITVYLSSQRELGYQFDLLLPFAFVAGLVFVLGIILWNLPRSEADRDQGTLPVRLWLYYLAGPYFLAFTLLREAPLFFLDELPGVLLALLLLAVAAVYLSRLASQHRIVGFFAILSVAFTVSEAARFAGGAEFVAPAEPVEVSELQMEAGDADLPNIYHIVLDGFQSDVFGLIATDDVRDELEGFTWFEDASASYEQTVWSIPSVFLGTEYDLSRSHLDFQAAAFRGPGSLLTELKDIGYSTIAFSRKLYQFDYTMFDKMVQHANNIGVLRPDDSDAFLTLFIYRSLPGVAGRALSRRGWLISAADMRNLGANTFLASSAPIESSLGFQKYLEQEVLLPAAGRYTFIHLIMPHDPFVLDGNCGETKKSDVIRQSQCATRLIAEFAYRLKSMDRYDDSIIVIHGDHGERYRAEGATLSEIDYRSHRTLLLLKPPLAGDRPSLRTSQAPASLIDIAPTIYELVGRESDDHEGYSLLTTSSEVFAGRQRRYNVVVDESHFRQYRVDGRELFFEKDVALPKANPDIRELLETAPLISLNVVVEAESAALSNSVDVASDLPGTQGAHVSNGSVSFRFELESDATVQLKLRLIAPSGNNNSSFIRMNGGDADVWDMPIARDWAWRTFDKAWNLSRGTHLLSIENREQIYIDQIELIRN